MEDLIQALRRNAEARGVRFRLGARFEWGSAPGPVVLCVSAADAADILQGAAARAAGALASIRMLPLLTANLFFPPAEGTLKGFGVLFSPRERFRALGVVFGGHLFERGSPAHAETWILGGALDPGALELSDQQILDLLAADRLRLFGRERAPLACYLNRRPRALPHYDLGLEALLRDRLELPPGVHLVGNYLGGIGLARILDRAHEVVERLLQAPDPGS
jgi:oxygen-dependent protoporphyrinogen oxidase